ncbi:cysteine dioxygenase, partial [Saccharothrix sp. MB29]|nr:cysteine dioxygenase [Saccharothrix sp. MB29]
RAGSGTPASAPAAASTRARSPPRSCPGSAPGARGIPDEIPPLPARRLPLEQLREPADQEDL